jgi:hypothetical protein
MVAHNENMLLLLLLLLLQPLLTISPTQQGELVKDEIAWIIS